MQFDPVARFDRTGRGFRTNARKADLPIGIVGIDEIDVERNLSMNTDGLHFLDQGGLRPLEHRPECTLDVSPFFLSEECISNA